IILEDGKIICNDKPDYVKFNEELLFYFPICTRIFDERPLNVKTAVNLAGRLKQKDVLADNEDEKPSVILKNVSFAYSKNDKDILSRLNFKAYKSKINCIIGSNASGKTTLLKIIAQIKKQYSGKVKLYGKCAYMPQNVKYLFTKDTVKEEISADTAAKLGIAECLNQHPFDLSGGQAQKLAFGILLEQDADIFLLDEPTKAFDEFSKLEVKKLLFDLKNQGKSIIMVSHDLDFVGDVADYVSFLSDAIISKAGSRREVFSSLNFYTTQVRRITKRYLESAVSMEDIV
uniref:ABC transporter ATP-binding protein n=1 Tax=Eubacterium sp. TaxID=142586 RepID=UPI004026FA48